MESVVDLRGLPSRGPWPEDEMSVAWEIQAERRLCGLVGLRPSPLLWFEVKRAL